jgi:hypothetical protein
MASLCDVARCVPPLCLAQDKANPNPALSAEALARYAMLGPSINMADAFFKAAVELEKPIHAWTVDTPAALHRCAWGQGLGCHGGDVRACVRLGFARVCGPRTRGGMWGAFIKCSCSCGDRRG